MVVTDILWMAILFLIPGMASFTVYRHVAGYAIDRLYKFFFYSAIWAILDYGIVEIIAWFIYDIPLGKYQNIWFMFHYKFADISLDLMLWALIAGGIAAWVIGLFMRWVRLYCPGLLYIKLWDYYVNFLWKKQKRVAIYDYKNKYKYVGYIKSFSYFSSRKEVVLHKPEIYALKGEKAILLEKEKVEEIYVQLEDNCFSILALERVCPNPESGEEKVICDKRKDSGPLEVMERYEY